MQDILLGKNVTTHKLHNDPILFKINGTVYVNKLAGILLTLWFCRQSSIWGPSLITLRISAVFSSFCGQKLRLF